MARTSGRRALDESLDLGSASLVVLCGGGGAGTSGVLRAAAASYAAGCGRAAIIFVGPWSRVSLPAGVPQAALDRLFLMRVPDEGSLLAAARAVSSMDLGFVALDDASHLSAVSRSAAPRSLMALAISRAVYRRGIQAMVALLKGASGIIGYEYWWPFADLLVELEALQDGTHRAASRLGEARFRIFGGIIMDARPGRGIDARPRTRGRPRRRRTTKSRSRLFRGNRPWRSSTSL